MFQTLIVKWIFFIIIEIATIQLSNIQMEK